MKKLWIKIVKLRGWKFVIPDRAEHPEIDRCVVAVAPHTCIEDFFVGAAVLMESKVNFRIFMKKEFFNWFTSPILHKLGVIPVDRGNRHNGLVDSAVKAFKDNERMAIVITPEGTRKAVKRWKRGFYEIAVQAQVPIYLCYMDFAKKEAGYGPLFYPTGDFQTDLPEMMKFYEGVTAKFPELYNKHCDAVPSK